MSREYPPLRVGDMLYGFCCGYFGRDSYEDKRVEGLGTDWIVARDEQGKVHVAIFETGDDMDDLLEDNRELPSERR